MADESLFTGFHGTSTPSLRLEDLDPRRGVEAEGTVFFTSNEDMAHSFTLPREYGETVFERPTGEFGEFGEELYADIEPGPVLKASLRMRNPFRIKGKEAQQAIDDTTYQGKILQQAKSGGFDGVVFEDVTEFADPGVRGDVYAVFNKDQIQSVQEPRPKDQPRAPLLLEGPSEDRTGKEPSKGRMFRGIGSLMRGRNILSLLQGLREGYELLPEEYQVLDEALQYLKGTQFSIDKPGIESLKEWLGISPEDLGETIPLPGPPQETVESRPKGLSEPSYHTYDQETRDYWDTHLEHNALRQNPKTGWAAERSYLLEAAGDVLRELTGSTGFIASGGTEKGYLNEKLNRLKREARTVSPKYMAERRYVEGLGGPAFGPAEGEKEQLEDIGISIARIKPKSEEAALAKSILSNIADSDSYLLNSNIDKLRRKLGLLSEEEEELDRLINEPRPKAAGGFIDKPLYDDQRMIG